MQLTNLQTEAVLKQFLTKENGLNEVLEMLMNSLVYSERESFPSPEAALALITSVTIEKQRKNILIQYIILDLKINLENRLVQFIENLLNEVATFV